MSEVDDAIGELDAISEKLEAERPWREVEKERWEQQRARADKQLELYAEDIKRQAEWSAASRAEIANVMAYREHQGAREEREVAAFERIASALERLAGKA